MPVDIFDFANLRYIDVKVSNVLCLGRELRRIAGDPVVEPGANRNQKIAIFNRVVCESHAMHAEHMQ